MKEKLKVRFTVHFNKAINIPKGAGSVLIEWRRGSRRRSGKIKIVDVNPNTHEAIWNEDLVIETKVEASGEVDKNQTLEARNFQEKRISIYVKEGKKTGLLKKHKVIGKTEFNLSEYIRGDPNPVPLSRILTSKTSRPAGKEPALTFTIKSEVLKLGRIALSPVKDPAAAKNTITLNGVKYEGRPEENHTETTLETDSESEKDVDEFEEDLIDDSHENRRATIGPVQLRSDDSKNAISPLVAKSEENKRATISSMSSLTEKSTPPKEEKKPQSPETNKAHQRKASNPSVSFATTTTVSQPAPKSTTTTTVVSTSSTQPPSKPTPAKSVYSYNYPIFTPAPIVKYKSFADRPLSHKVLATIVALCAVLILRVTLFF
eukprot:TRINITY_DN1505_c0_g1_i1.p1 TRINITY_DN1505_c0_g1~~TRINITY_DN1505_c0_g1_i1.p1  ORF type:complete len:375 (-),score=87.08 TRINITY_DN1505_c0_g1_i1:142-1266(-)